MQIFAASSYADFPFKVITCFIVMNFTGSIKLQAVFQVRNKYQQRCWRIKSLNEDATQKGKRRTDCND